MQKAMRLVVSVPEELAARLERFVRGLDEEKVYGLKSLVVARAIEDYLDRSERSEVQSGRDQKAS
jgi:metal-responsive CopG/Arc/MetJ family transcriptional regulator